MTATPSPLPCSDSNAANRFSTMPYATCRLSLIPVRREPDLVSEMTTQIRCGESVEILETKGAYWRVRLLTDGYEGWVTARQFGCPLETPPAAAIHFTDDLCGATTCGDRHLVLPLGSPLPDFKDGTFLLNGERWPWTGLVRTVPAGVPDLAALIAYARRFLHAPYQWGGRTVFGIDCSGFMQSVFRLFGFPLLRDSKQQATQGTAVSSLAEAVPGDLLFFGSEALGIYHVGLLLSCGEVIHASTMVRVDDISEAGIRNRETGELSHRLWGIRRML